MKWRFANCRVSALFLVAACAVFVVGHGQPQQVKAQDSYHLGLQRELAQKRKLPAGESIFGATEEEVLSRFHLHGPAADAGTMRVIDVQGQPFRKALRIDVNRLQGEFWHTMLQALSPVPLKKGEVLLVTLYARGGVPNVAGSPALTGVSIKPIPGDPHGFATRELVLTDQWERIQMPVVVTEDREVGKLEWISALSSKIQWVEFGGISVIKYGLDVKPSDLPDSAAVRADYAGRSANAPWRKEALARIEKIRKGDLKVRVVDAQGKPVPQAQVKVEMTRHAFRWGTAIVPSIEIEPIPDWNRTAHEAQFKHLFSLFNHIAVDIDLKFDRWYGSSAANKARVLEGLQMFKDRGMSIHGHTMIWPSFGNMPQAAQFRDDPGKMREELRNHIREIAAKTAPYTQTWDVVNEPYGNQEITRILGDGAIGEWFRVARAALPKTRLYINEGITPGGGGATEAYYYDVCRKLVAEGAPVDGIGLQSHIGGSPTDMPKVWASLQKFAGLKPGMELSISEFDINFRGDKQLEHDYTRDFTILAFSHPAVKMFTMWGFHDPYHWLKYAPLFNPDGSLKPSGKAWMDLVHGAWKTKAQGRTGAKGEYATRGFLGDYEVTVSRSGKSQTVKTSVPKGGRALVVRLGG
jgi:hypothetical protein